MNLIDRVLIDGVSNDCSDIHFTFGLPPVYRISGSLTKSNFPSLNEEILERLAKSMLDEKKWKEFIEVGEIDVAYSIEKVSRFRVNVYRQKGYISIAVRIIKIHIPTAEKLGIPFDLVKKFTETPKGFCLITGPTGSGKSTTLAAIIDYMNSTMKKHIITLEDPIEYVHENKQSVIEGREIGSDTLSFENGLRAALRQDPDVILVGEMRDLTTIQIALSAAETGHLVFGTLHTTSAAGTIERIVDVFDGSEQTQIRIQLANTLIGVMSQVLLPKANGDGRVLAHEILFNTPAIANMIRSDKIHQIDNVLQTSKDSGMHTMKAHVTQLHNNGFISEDVARLYLA